MFHKYPSIENSYNKEFVESIRSHGFDVEKYCVTEKIHGTNTQIAYYPDEDKFVYGTRERVLPDDEKCYNAQEIFDDLQVSVKVVHEIMSDSGSYPNLTSVILFGELYGGAYPHTDVEKDKHAIRVQKGVYYSQHNQWRVFDIAYTVSTDDYLHFVVSEEFFNLCDMAGIEHVPLLKIADSLDEALAYQNDGESVVSSLNNLPKIDNNIMEGVVIKPWQEDLWTGSHRVILKNKNDKFKEKWREKKVDIQEEVPEVVKQAINELAQYINENRVNNVISHLGQVSVKDIGNIIALSTTDALEDYKKDYGTLNTMDKNEEKMVTRFLGKEMAKTVRKVIMDR